MTLAQKIQDRSARVGVMALGYVGLPLIRAFWNAGFHVIGFDTDPHKTDMLQRGENYLKHLGENFVSDMTASNRFQATSDMTRLGETDVLLVCVPTPLGPHQEPDLSFVEQSSDAIAATLRPNQLIVLESTTYPGTTRDVVLPRLLQSGLTCGRDFFLAYSPEREDPGRKNASTRTIPKLVAGIDPTSGELAANLYRQAVDQVIPCATTEIAEAAKLLENVYRAVNIALVNELKVILTRLNIDVWQVIDAAATKPFGYQAFYPGPGLGGHCIPIDPFYLAFKAREAGQTTRFIELAGQINHDMPSYVVNRTMLALNQHSKAVKGSKLLVLGLAYKPDVDDVRESPSFQIIQQLKALGADVDYHDPHVPHTPRTRKHDLKMSAIDLNEHALARYDAVLIATHHSAYDWPMIARSARLIIDTRGVMRHLPEPREHIVTA